MKRHDWEDYEDAWDRGPVRGSIKVLGGILIVGLLAIPMCSVLSTASEAANVAQQEVGPRALLRKYEWFKDASAQLAAKQADLAAFTHRMERAQDRFEARPSRSAEENLTQVESEFVGVQASYNQLAAEYNANMAKINYAFTNRGQVPAGSETLPRNYAEYLRN